MSRTKGAINERKVVAWLRDHAGRPDARRYLAGDGRQPGDIDAIPGLSIEVRARATCKPGSWLQQAEQAAGDRQAIIVYHPPGVADVGQWVVMERLDTWLARWDADDPPGHTDSFPRCIP
jgi:hypothetical protein